MEKYLINYGTGRGNKEILGTLEEAMELADENIAYTMKNVQIETEHSERIVAQRIWENADYDNVKKEEIHDPIIFGSEGYYSDWEVFK